MSGCFRSTGKQTNKGEGQLNISDILNLRIESLDIYSIPLSTGFFGNLIRGFGKILQPFFHPAISPTFCHIAIKLNLENMKDIIIIEYGQYLTKESEKDFGEINKLFSSNFREEENNVEYYYINDDGVRITRIEKKENIIMNEKYIASFIGATAAVYFGNAVISILNRNVISQIINQVDVIKCDVNNKITLKDLKQEFLGEKWKAKKYNLASHNCQDFAAEVVKILKAVRIHDKDKIRMLEKKALPNCLINALTNNEE